MRVTNNERYDFLSSNNAWCIQYNSSYSTIHVVYLTDSVRGTGSMWNVIHKAYNAANNSLLYMHVLTDPYAPVDLPEALSLALLRTSEHLNACWIEEDTTDRYSIESRRTTNNGMEWLPQERIASKTRRPRVVVSNVAGPDVDQRYFRVHYVWVETEEAQFQDEEGDVYYKNEEYKRSSLDEEPPMALYRLTYTGSAALPSVAASSNYVFAVWQDDYETSDRPQIYLRRNTYYGTADSWKPQQRISDPMTPGWAEKPCIAANAPYVYVVWEQHSPQGYDDHPIIYFRRSTDNGVTWGNIEAIGYYEVGGKSPYAPRQYTPSICVSGSKVYVAWQNGIIYYPTFTILAKRSVDNGVNWSQSHWVGGYEEVPPGMEPELNPSVSAEGDVLYVVWCDYRPGAPSREVYYWKIDTWTDGSSGGGVQAISSLTVPIEELSVNPNPVTNCVTVAFHINQTAPVKIGVYDRTGRLVSIVADANLPPGKHDIVWHCTDLNGNRLDKGIYLLRVLAGGFSSCNKLTVIR
ncbi:MAG: FlgD immunoglobulin-like domain containing protein [candidate division WOR-3 bacterium]